MLGGCDRAVSAHTYSSSCQLTDFIGILDMVVGVGGLVVDSNSLIVFN